MLFPYFDITVVKTQADTNGPVPRLPLYMTHPSIRAESFLSYNNQLIIVIIIGHGRNLRLPFRRQLSAEALPAGLAYAFFRYEARLLPHR